MNLTCFASSHQVSIIFNSFSYRNLYVCWATAFEFTRGKVPYKKFARNVDYRYVRETKYDNTLMKRLVLNPDKSSIACSCHILFFAVDCRGRFSQRKILVRVVSSYTVFQVK
jgi:hypothetical protein